MVAVTLYDIRKVACPKCEALPGRTCDAGSEYHFARIQMAVRSVKLQIRAATRPRRTKENDRAVADEVVRMQSESLPRDIS